MHAYSQLLARFNSDFFLMHAIDSPTTYQHL